MEASVRELKSGLSRYLGQVQRGETIIVTSRGTPIAQLVPLPLPPVSERLAALPGIDAGAGGKPEGATRPVRIERGQKSVSDLVLQGRR